MIYSTENMVNKNPYAPCFLCPRRCGADRGQAGSPALLSETGNPAGRPGQCGEGAALRLAFAGIHRGEEPPLTGGPEGGGSGAVFVSGCNLGCVFCQNRQLSGSQNARRAGGGTLGRPVDAAEFARICLALQERGAENINIVTGSHAVPALVEGIAAARSGQAGFPGRLTVPVLWNSSAYELPETLELLAGQADVFLPDLKTLDRAAAARYFHAPDYPEIAPAAIEKMLSLRPLRFAGAPAADPQAGIAAETAVNAAAKAAGQARLVSGVLIRHLVLPGCLPASRAVLRWFADHCAGRALLSVMFQYTPVGPAGPGYPPGGPRRTVSGEEYETVLGWLEEFSIEDGYCQELVSGNLPLPDFNRPGPFPAGLAVPVWHWRTGFV